MRAKVQGEIATDITREDRTIDIRLRSEERYRDSVRDLRNLNVNGASTTAIPLQAVAEVVETTGPAEIRRSDGSRTALITANLVGDRDLGSVSRDIEAVLQRLEMPLGFDWKLGGQRQEMQTSFDSMRLAALLAVFMVYLVMASQFESLLHPFVILFSVPYRRHRRAGHAVVVRRHHQRRGDDRRHHAGRHRRQQRHPPDRLHQPAPPAG